MFQNRLQALSLFVKKIFRVSYFKNDSKNDPENISENTEKKGKSLIKHQKKIAQNQLWKQILV